MNNTPETDKLRESLFKLKACNSVSYQEMVMLARRFERERDELKRELSDLFKWVERRSQDGFIDSQTTEQNITRCYDALYDRLDDAIHERDEAIAALQTIASLDFTITLPDRMDAVRDIVNKALNTLKP